ncbi:PREDICTED: ethylene-responsive transcription factor ERF015-like [Populus euphratica]|uniref:Ethylene-responsive transcription factor ERF015-like n=1 Tax=Populus euphratica TaxID=75702 RepID=A0AAJ6TFA3_POPEU|nr:PREDICTED: ethylene-responsive transcription factor ERF015-like [Populus euphratica]
METPSLWQADNVTLPAFTLKHSIVEHLLLMDPCQSSAPPKKFPRGRNSGIYRGVRMRTWGKWVSEIRVPKTGQRIWLGSYDAPEKAARACDAIQYCIRGELSPSVITPVEMVEPSLPNLQVLSATGNAGNVEGYAPASASVPDLCSIDNLQLDDLLMLDIEWIDSL